MNDAKGDPASDPETVTHTSDGKKRKVTYTSNRDLQQTLLNNGTLLIVTTTMDPRIDNRIATCGGTPHSLTTPMTKEVITDAVYSIAQGLLTPRRVKRTGRDVTTPGDIPHSVRSPRSNFPVLISGIGLSPASRHSGSLQVFNKQQSAIYDKIGDTQKLDTSIDRKLPDDRYSAPIFNKVIGHELSHGSSANL